MGIAEPIAAIGSGVMGYKSNQLQAAALQQQGQTAAAAADLQVKASEVQALGVQAQTQGQVAGFEHAADQSTKLAEAGKVAADQTDAALRTELNSTLRNIEAIRVAAGADPFSPTGVALMDKQSKVSENNRLTNLSNYLQQIGLNQSDAAYFMKAAKMAVVSGTISEAGVRLGGSAARVTGYGQQAATGLAAEGASYAASGSLLSGIGKAASSINNMAAKAAKG